MKREEVFAALFAAEFCEPTEKAAKEKELRELLERACEETRQPLYALKPAILKLYPQYRAKRLLKELPNIPFRVRDK